MSTNNFSITTPFPSSDASALIRGNDAVAEEDLRAIVAWVASKRDSVHTQRAFRIEAQRWLAWLIWNKASENHATFLDKAKPIDASAYAHFLKMAPKPAFPAWVLSRAGMRRQPFRQEGTKDRVTSSGRVTTLVPMAPATIERAISALKAMYADLVVMTADEAFCIPSNPFSRFKIATVARKATPRAKGLTPIERGFVDEALANLRMEGKLALYHHLRWIWNALKWTALRRSELASAVAGDIYQDIDEEGSSLWMMTVTGKGNKQETIPLSDVFMEEFKLYRQHHGLPGLPTFGAMGEADPIPLVLPASGANRPVNDITIYRAMKTLMLQAANVAVEQGNPAAAARLRTFAAHSARHTSITAIVDATGDITLGQDLARHSSITTTRAYKAKSVSRLKAALQNLKTF